MDIKDAIKMYCANKAPQTATTYDQVWRAWCKNHSPDAAKMVDAAKFISELQCSDNTRRKYLNVLRTLYDVLLDLQLVTCNPFAQAARFMSARKAQQVRPTQRVSARDVGRLLKSEALKPWKTIRDRAALAVLFGCGLRRSELVRLNLDDVRISHDGLRYLRLRDTKAGVEQEQPVPLWVWRYLQKLVTERVGDGAGEHDPLFGSIFNGEFKRIGCSALWKLFKRCCAKLELDPRISCHAARASFATVLLEQGVPLDQVQRALRHATPHMTACYDKRLKVLHDHPGWRVAYK